MKFEFEITKITYEGYELPIPPGFSEFMNRAGAWKYVKPNEIPKPDDKLYKDYTRKVVLENGKLRTYLTYIGQKNKE